MTNRKPPKGLSDEQKRVWLQDHKNRNKHSVKFPDDLEADFENYRRWYRLSANAAIRQLVKTNPQLKIKPTNG